MQLRAWRNAAGVASGFSKAQSYLELLQTQRTRRCWWLNPCPSGSPRGEPEDRLLRARSSPQLSLKLCAPYLHCRGRLWSRAGSRTGLWCGGRARCCAHTGGMSGCNDAHKNQGSKLQKELKLTFTFAWDVFHIPHQELVQVLGKNKIFNDTENLSSIKQLPPKEQDYFLIMKKSH